MKIFLVCFVSIQLILDIMNFILFACFIISAQAFDFVSLEGGAALHKCRRLTADGNGVIYTTSQNATN